MFVSIHNHPSPVLHFPISTGGAWRHSVYTKKINSFLLSSITAAISATSFHATAADNAQNEIIVTANRYSQTINESLSSVTVITRDEIEKSAATDLPSLLGQVAGVDTKNNGTYGKQSSIFLRGTNSSHTLTLIDGVKLTSASAGLTAFQHIPLEQIERIEIVRGPRSSLYGSEAIGGVIQIFTRKGGQNARAASSFGYGGNNTRKMTAQFSGSDGTATFSLNANHTDTDGIDAIRHTSSNDDDGYNNESVSMSFGYLFNDNLSFDASFMNAQGNTEFDNCFNNTTFASSDDCDANFVQQTFSSTFNFTPDGIWDSQLLIGSSRDNNENFWESQANFAFETRHNEISFLNNFQLNENNLLTLGVDYAEDTVDTQQYASDTPDSRDNTAGFIAWDSQLASFDLNISLRQDDNEQFAKHNTGSLALGRNLGNNLKLVVSYGTAFKAPTFNDLYFPFYGDDSLDPEESATTEVSLRGSHRLADWSLNLFRTDIDNLIASDPATFTASNIDKAQITGAELITEFTTHQWDFDVALTYIDGENQSGINEGRQLIARAKENFSLQAYRSFGKFGINASLLAQGKRYTSLDNSESLAGYGIIDTSIDYALNKQMKLTAKINNIADTRYAINADSFNGTYNTLGRTLFVNLSYNM